MMTNQPLIGIVMGSDSDLPLMQATAKILEELDISFETTLVSAHRTPERLNEYTKHAQESGIKVIIACAGGAAHLPGMIASYTSLPVIGVPRKLKNLDGIDSLLSMVQMPEGIPVATVAIDGATNAGLLAGRILGTYDQNIRQKLDAFRKKLNDNVLDKAKTLEKAGYKAYLDEHHK